MARPRILLQGVGGIGGVMAGRLARAGHAPVLVTGNEAIAEAINSRGVRVRAGDEEFVAEARAHPALDDLPPGSRFDVSLLVMKAHPVVDVARRTLPFLDPDGGHLVTCQNGIVEDAVAEVVGAGRVVSGIVGWGATMHEPGVYEKTGPGQIHLGELDGSVTHRVRDLARVLESVTEVDVSDNIRGALWSKLGINCTITTMGALTGETLGEMLEDREIRDVFLAIYSEVVRTADAMGVRLESIAAPPRLLYVPPDAGRFTRAWKDLIVRLIGRRYTRLRSSMLQGLERGRLTEIDFLNGHVVEKARDNGVRVPLNEALVRIIKEIETGDRRIEKANMADLLAAGPRRGD